MSTTEVIIHLPFIPLLLTTAYVFLQWRKLDKALNVLRWFAVFEFLMQTTATVLAFYNILNTPLLYLYVPVDFLLKSFFYARLLSNSINTRIIYLFMVGFILYCLTDVLFISDLHVFNSVALSIQSILMVILTLSTFFIMVESEFMENNPTTRVNILTEYCTWRTTKINTNYKAQPK